MQVAKWGNSLAIRLPAVIVEALELKVGDQVDLAVAGTRSFDLARDNSRAEALARIRARGLTIPKDFKFDREEANAR